MPVTQRWVHGGLILAAIILSMSLTVLILGAARKPVQDVGLPGSPAAAFQLKNRAGEAVRLEPSRLNRVVVLIFANHRYDLVSKQSSLVNRLVETYGEDDQIRIVGIASDRDAALFGPGATVPASLETDCPNLSTGLDRDGTIARAYRVHNRPTMFVIDRAGVIRARINLDDDSAAITAYNEIQAHRGVDVPIVSPISGEPKMPPAS